MPDEQPDSARREKGATYWYGASDEVACGGDLLRVGCAPHVTLVTERDEAFQVGVGAHDTSSAGCRELKKAAKGRTRRRPNKRRGRGSWGQSLVEPDSTQPWALEG